jgi:plastocyanin
MEQRHNNITGKLVAALALGALLAACVDDAPTTPPPVTDGPTVTIEDMHFTPSQVTIEAGDTLTWVWNDGVMSHNVSGDGFESETQSDGSFSHTFDVPGDFPYVCTLHSGMRGTVTVER